MDKTLNKFVFLFLILISSSIFSQGVKREIIWSDYPYPIAEEFKHRIKFGHIVVPETRNSENPRTLKIAFCILKGSSNNGLKNPVILLPGGPGLARTDKVVDYLEPTHWKNRLKFMDIVFFDPRGCGKSEPDLCPDLDFPEFKYLSLLGKTDKEIEQEKIRVLKKCLDSLTLEKVDLNAYGSDEVAEDIEDLRVSIGVEKWNIQGGSYGTRYGQGLIRKFPKTVRSAVFNGLVPTVRCYRDDNLRSSSRSLQLIFKKCANDIDCASKYPDLENKLFDALAYYNQNPLIIPANQQKLVKNSNIMINGDTMIGGIISLLYGPLGVEIVPMLIEAVADRKDWVIMNFANSIGSKSFSNSDMLLYINCNDNPYYGLQSDSKNYDAFTNKLKPYLLNLNNKSQYELGQLSGINLDSTQQIPIPSEIPVMLVTGEFDPITPPENTVITSKYLTNSVVLTLPNNSHSLRNMPLYSKAITAFYKTLELPTNIEQITNDIKPLKFVTDVNYNKGIAQVGSKILMGKQNQIYIPLGISLFLVIFGFLGIPIYGIIRYFKQRKNKILSKSKNIWLPWILTLFVLAFVALFYFAITDTLSRNPYILGFGILSSWSWIFWLIPLILALLIFSFMKRKEKINIKVSKFSNVLVFFSWIGTLLFVSLMLFWNVLWPFSS